MALKKNNSNQSDVNLLLSVINKHKNIIECKKSGTFTVKVKNKVWAKIKEEFNSKTISHLKN